MDQNTDNIVQSNMTVVCVTNDGENASYFDKRSFELSGNNQRMLSEQITAVNFRLRTSDTKYASDWHVAGDPTLLIILSGCIQIELRNGKTKRFRRGEMFIAEDYLTSETNYNKSIHGHRAQVVSDDDLQVLHLKLNKRKN